MAHTYTNLLTHALFSTKDRQPMIRTMLFEGGIFRPDGAGRGSGQDSPSHGWLAVGHNLSARWASAAHRGAAEHATGGLG